MERKDEQGPGESLIETIHSSDLTNILKDISELGLDSALSDGLLKNIPIINWIIGLGKTAIAVRDYFLIRKLHKFFEGLAEITEPEKAQFLTKIEANKNFKRRLGENIVMLLDRLDHIDKADMVSKVFCAYIREEINFDEFSRISGSIDQAFLGDLNSMLEYFADKLKDVTQTKRNLHSSDFSDFYVITEEEFQRSDLEHPQVYHFNKQAQTFARIILKDGFHEGRW